MVKRPYLKIGAAQVAIGMVAVVVLRVKTVGMTEGQAFLAYWPYWCGAVVLMCAGVLVASKE